MARGIVYNEHCPGELKHRPLFQNDSCPIFVYQQRSSVKWLFNCNRMIDIKALYAAGCLVHVHAAAERWGFKPMGRVSNKSVYSTVQCRPDNSNQMKHIFDRKVTLPQPG